MGQFSQNYSNGDGFSGTTSATLLDPADDTAGPWRLRYDYGASPYGDWDTYRIASLLLNVVLPVVDDKKPPKKELDLGSPHTTSAESTIHLPRGYSVELPDAIHLKTAFATFDKTYQYKSGSLVAESKLKTLMAKVPASDWKEYKKFVDAIGVESWIQLTSQDRSTGEKGPPLAGENNPAAAELVSKALDAVTNKRDKELARGELDQAAAINDKQRSLWSQRGYLATLDNQLDVAGGRLPARAKAVSG